MSCDTDTTSRSSTSLDDALQRADRTRFVAAASLPDDRSFSAGWLRRMAAHRAAQTAQRGSQRERAPLRPVVALLPPEPEVARSSAEDVFADVLQLLASYCEALRLAFIVVDVLLVSYHVTRTCVSAHALWTVGFRERVTLRLPDVAFLRCDVRQLRAGRVPSVVGSTDAGGQLPSSVTAACDGKTQHLAAESLTDVSVANHSDTLLASTLSNHPAVDSRRPPSTCNTFDRKSLPIKVTSSSAIAKRPRDASCH